MVARERFELLCVMNQTKSSRIKKKFRHRLKKKKGVCGRYRQLCGGSNPPQSTSTSPTQHPGTLSFAFSEDLVSVEVADEFKA